MSQLEAYAAFVASGSAGAQHTILSSYGQVSAPGSKMWLTYVYEATRTTGTGILTLEARIHWYNINDVEITPYSVQTTFINATTGRVFKEFEITVPAGATKARVGFAATPAASPMQHDFWLSSIRLGKTQLLATAGATWGQNISDPNGLIPENQATVDATLNVVNPTIMYADSAGVLKAGEIDKEIQISLVRLGNVVTTGAAWIISLISGNVTFTANTAAGYLVLKITGPTGADLALESIVRVKSVYNNITRVVDVIIRKQNDPPTNSGSTGGSGSQSSTTTLGATTGTAYDLTNAISQALTAQAGPNGEVVCTAPISFNRQLPKSLGDTGARGKWQWRVPAGAWADIFTEGASTLDASTDETAEGFVFNTSGNISVTQIKNGLTPGSTYEFRFVWRRIDTNGALRNIIHVNGTMMARGQ